MDEILRLEDIQRLLLSGETGWQQYGMVNVQVQGDLALFDYAQKAQFMNRWNWFESHCRGLILNRKTGEIVARPFDKFYNWFEGRRRAKGHIVAATEKLDGSMGILYRVGGEYRIATRGSMNSQQAQWATAYLNQHWREALSDLPDEWTLIFEIIYPENRVIIDYGSRQDLVLLAIRNRFTGDYVPHYEVDMVADKYAFVRPQYMRFANVYEILEAAGRIDSSQEGWVVEFSDGSRFKFKGDRYRELHQLVSGLS